MSPLATKELNRKKMNIAIVAVLAVVALTAFAAVTMLGAGTGAARQAVVQDADGNTLTLALDRDDTVTVTSSAGTNVVQVKDGAVAVIEADCPNLDCVHQGAVSGVGQQIVCLPHKLVVSVEEVGGEGDAGYDVVGK